VPAESDLGSAGECYGVITIPIGLPISTTLLLYWGKVISGADGQDGADGADGSSASYVVISAPTQVFSKPKGQNNYSPASILLTATLYGEIAGSANYQWYKDNTKITTGGTGKTYNVTDALMGSGATSTYRCESKDTGGTVYSDAITLVRVQDGVDGADGTDGTSPSTVFLTNENITFAANASGQVSAITVTSNVVAYTGTTKTQP
jgi:hypothetical protein